jgi:hypothetical protein
MTAVQMRGYVLSSAAAYIKDTAGQERGAKVLASLSPHLRRALETVKPAGWCSAENLSELYRAVASLTEGDEDRTRESLIECGRYTAREASNTFLRILMKLLTPAMFAKKLPDFWARDCTGGKIEVQLKEDMLANRLTDMKGLEHIGPVAVGYVKFALEAMGKSVTRTKLYDWSLADPGPNNCSFEIFWKT